MAMLAASILALLLLGRLVLKRLDRFLEGDCPAAFSEQKEEQAPLGVLLAGTLPDEELLEEIHRFRQSYAQMRILLYNADYFDEYPAKSHGFPQQR